MKSFLFKLRYVYRNITRNFFRTLSLFLTIMMLSFIFLTFYTIHGAISSGFYLHEDSLVENVDIYVTYDTESSSHIVDSSKMKSVYEYVDFYAPFFEMSSVIQIGESTSMVTVLAGDSSDLSLCLRKELPYLQQNEVIITNSLSKNLNIKIGDEIEVFIGSEKVVYIVKDIVEDRSIFRDEKIMLPKDFFVKKYVKDVLNINMDDLSNIDIATTIYINLRDDITKENMIATLKGSSFYPTSVVRDPRNYQSMEPNINMLTGILYAVLIIFIVALSFVLISIVNLRIKGFKNEVGIVETLGEDKTYIFKVFIIEIVFLAILGFVGAFFLNNFIYTKEFSLVSIGLATFHYKYHAYQVLLTIGSILVVCGLAIFNSYRRYKKLEVLELTKNKQYETVFDMKKLIIINIILGTLTLLNWLVFTKIFSMKFTSPFGIVVTSLFGVMMVSLIVKLLCKLFKKDQVFKLTFLKNLSVNKIKHNSLKILLISMFGIMICFSCIETINKLINDIHNSINIGTVFVSPNGVTDEMVEDIESYSAVNAASKGWFERRLSTVDNKNSFLLVFSCDIEDTQTFMNFDVDKKYHEEFKNPNKQYIIVAEDFLKTTDYKIGDTISFTLSDGPHSYVILASAPIKAIEFAYTNDYYYRYDELNTIIISNNNDNVAMDEFRTGLMSKYCDGLCYIFDASGFLVRFLEKTDAALKLIYVIIAIILVCFIISIINNTILNFNEVKTDFAVMQILGISPKQLVRMIIKEMVISYMSVFLQLLMIVLLVIKYLPGLTMMLGYYVDILTSPLTFILGLLLGVFCFALSHIYYFIGIRKINLAQEVKK